MSGERVLYALAGLVRLVTSPFVRYVIRGGACVESMGTVVMAANHRSLFDLPAALVIMRHFRRSARVLVLSSIAEAWWARPWMRAIGIIPVDRDAAPLDALAAGVRALREGHSIAMMPEGRLTWDPQQPLALGRPRTGVSRLAVESGCPVLAIGLAGTEELWPKGARLPRLNPFRRVTVVAHVADELLHLEGDDHRANAAAVMERIGDCVRRATELRERLTTR